MVKYINASRSSRNYYFHISTYPCFIYAVGIRQAQLQNSQECKKLEEEGQSCRCVWQSKAYFLGLVYLSSSIAAVTLMVVLVEIDVSSSNVLFKISSHVSCYKNMTKYIQNTQILINIAYPDFVLSSLVNHN
jgi:hypothetical protein